MLCVDLLTLSPNAHGCERQDEAEVERKLLVQFYLKIKEVVRGTIVLLVYYFCAAQAIKITDGMTAPYDVTSFTREKADFIVRLLQRPIKE